MFWGLEMEPAKVYKQKVEKSFHVSMACLQPSKCVDSNYTSLILRKDGHDFVLCNLQKDKAIQVQLDLMFASGDDIAFTLTGGKNKIYLSGYILEEDDQLFEESDSEIGDAIEEEMPTLVEGKRKPEPSAFESKTKKAKLKIDQSDDDSDESDNSDESGKEDNVKGGDEEDSDESSAEGDEEDDDSEEGGESGSESDELDSDEEKTPVKLATAKTPDKSKNKSPAMRQEKTPVTTPTSQVNGTTPKSKKKNRVDTPQVGKNAGTPISQKTPKETSPQKTKLEGGVIAMDTKVGSGAYAKAGKRVAVYYSGRLQQNNKQFDSSTQGKGFVFQLGRGEVIKGWDIGVAGMKVGGKRKIVVPAPLAYGSKGSPPVIPPNANLVFEIELKNVY